jgi:Xaa-Pro aminopeptidase
MFEAHFQSFDDRGDRAESAPRVAALRAELKRAGSTDSSCRAPTASRTNTCRRAPSGSPGSPASPARPASPSCSPTAPSSFVDGRYQVQVREEIDSAIFSVEHLVEQPPTAWIEANLPAGAARLFAVAAHGRRRRTARQGLRGGRSKPRAGRRQSDRRRLDRPAAAAARRGGAARSALAGEDAGQARARARRNAETLRRCAGGVRSASGLVAVQHPRQRHPAHAGGARLRHGAEGRPAGALVDLRKLGNDMRHRLEEVADVRPNAAFERDLAALGKEHRARCGSIRRPARGDRAPDRRERRQGRARHRSDRADEGGEERRRDRRRARGAAARRRGGDALSSPGSTAKRRAAN